MNYNDIKQHIDNKQSIIYPKQLIKENIEIINNNFKIDLSILTIGQIGKIIKNNLNPICICGKLKKWERFNIQNTCGDKICVTKHIKNTFIGKYGVDNPQSVQEIKNKTQKTNLDKYGKTSYLSTQEFQIKTKQTCMDRYGVNNISQYTRRKYDISLQAGIKNLDKLNKTFIEINFLSEDRNIKVDKFMEFYDYKCLTTVYDIFKKLNIDYNKKMNRSKYEDQIIDIIKESNIKFTNNRRDIIKNNEIDIFIQNYNIGIEFNGLYWHSYGKDDLNTSFKQSNKQFQQTRHLEKTQAFEALSKEHKLFHIFENEWINPIKQDIWKSMLLNSLGKSKPVYARKCTVKELDSKTSNNFIEANHIQGIRNAKVKLGLYYDNELISVMTFGKPLDTNSIYEYELIRFCNKKYINVIGGASKLLKYFERNYKPKSIISYANRRWSKGDLYHKLGFTLSNISNPNKFIIKGNKLYNRLGFQKHKLETILESFDSSLSADENIVNNNLRIIWDCGNYVFVKDYNK